MNKKEVRSTILKLNDAIHAGNDGIVIKLVKEQLNVLSSEYIFWQVNARKKYTDIEIRIVGRFSDGDTFVEMPTFSIDTNIMHGNPGLDVVRGVYSCFHHAMYHLTDRLLFVNKEIRIGYGRYINEIGEESK